MSTEPITRAIARTVKEATNGFINESIYAIPLQEEAPNAYLN